MAAPFAWSRSFFSLALSFATLFSTVVHARDDSLYTSSVTYCVPPQAILIQEFSIIYFAANQSVSFNISAASVQPDLRVQANILVNVYGMQPVNVTKDFCRLFGSLLCPLPTYNFTGSTSIQLPSSLNVASRVPNIAYTIPDLESFAQLTLTDINSGEVAACIQATLSNGWSTHQPAVSFGTGGFAIFALFSALFHSLLPSTPLAPPSSFTTPSLAPSRFVDFVLLFQQISSSGLLHLNFPLLYRAFTLNFAWALGLFSESHSIQNAINRMRHLTGSKLQDGVQSPIAFVNRALSPYNVPLPPGSSPSSFLAFANAAYLASNRTIAARDISTESSSGNGPPATVTNDGNILPAGIPVYINSLNIGTANAFMSVFFTVLIGAVLGAAVLGVMYMVLSLMVTRLKGNRWAWTDIMHAEFRWFAVSNGIRYAMVVVYPVLIFTFFQWTLTDSWLVVFLSVITLLCTAVVIIYPTVQTLLIARRASPQELYTIPSYIRTLGAFYIPFRQERYYFFVTLLAAAILKSIFISFVKASGLAQVVALLIIEVAVLVLLCIQKPHRSRGGDVLTVYLAVTRVITTGLMISFVQSLRVKAIPRVAIGFVLLVLHSIAIIVMIVSVIFHFGNGLLWRRRANIPLGSSTSSIADVEQSKMPSFDLEVPPILRITHPTPSTSFSQDQSTHTRHTPKMSAAVSPNYTIPSFCTSDSEDNTVESMLDSGEWTSRCSTRTQSGGSSFFTASTPPITSHADQFPLPPDSKPEPPSQNLDKTLPLGS